MMKWWIIQFFTSIKLTSGINIDKVVSPIILKVFTYDGDDDFNEIGQYQGNSYAVITVKKLWDSLIQLLLKWDFKIRIDECIDLARSHIKDSNLQKEETINKRDVEIAESAR